MATKQLIDSHSVVNNMVKTHSRYSKQSTLSQATKCERKNVNLLCSWSLWPDAWKCVSFGVLLCVRSQNSFHMAFFFQRPETAEKLRKFFFLRVIGRGKKKLSSVIAFRITNTGEANVIENSECSLLGENLMRFGGEGQWCVMMKTLYFSFENIWTVKDGKFEFSAESFLAGNSVYQNLKLWIHKIYKTP